MSWNILALALPRGGEGPKLKPLKTNDNQSLLQLRCYHEELPPAKRESCRAPCHRRPAYDFTRQKFNWILRRALP